MLISAYIYIIPTNSYEKKAPTRMIKSSPGLNFTAVLLSAQEPLPAALTALLAFAAWQTS